jgi:ubiquinone/menaquinone biosynthesis C-methylase UbiE
VTSAQFWDVLAPHHSGIENNYLDLTSVRHIMRDLQEPVLVVGGGQGLIVAEVRKKGIQCDGLDFSGEMVRQAKIRRGVDLIHADATAMPFGDGAYGTVLYATGVVDFTCDEQVIVSMIKEGRRVVKPLGRLFIAFYRFSEVLEGFLLRVGLLKENLLSQRECLQMYLLGPVEMVKWVAKRAGVGYLGALRSVFGLSVLGTLREKMMTLKMQTIFRDMDDPDALIQAAPEKIPYRNEAEIRRLFERLGIPLKEIRALPSCWIVRIE